MIPRRVVRFGIFEADLLSGELRRSGMRVKLHGQTFQVLAMLLNHPGEVVTREEFRNRLWPVDTFVDYEHSLNNAVNRLREALGDTAGTPRFIETLPRRGYRFIGSVNDGAAREGERENAPMQRSESVSVPREGQDSAKRLLPTREILLSILVAVSLVTIIAGVVLLRRPARTQDTGPHTIAVLPLQNTSSTRDFDFLRIGLADDIATTLSYFPALSIRPFATTSRYAGPNVDLQTAAQEMRVADIITGHFTIAADNVEVTLEAVDAANNRVIWRDTFRGTARDLTGIQQQIAAHVQHALISALGINATSNAFSNASHNAEAYELYLRAMSADNFGDSPSSLSSENKDPIHLLQRAVVLDPSYSSAWASLGHLYYYDITFGNGGKAARLRAKAALQRAVALDPGRIDAASDLVTMESEEGDINHAYDDIIRLLHHRPDSGAVHLVYSYVRWYGGLLDEAARECEKTRSLDAGTTDLASCFHIFMALGRYERAREYLQLQSGTEFERGGEVEILLREGKQDKALQKLKSLPTTPLYGRRLLEPCLLHRLGIQTKAVAIQQMRSAIMATDDPLPKYLLAAWDSFCGQPDLAYRELHRAIEQNYCAYPQIETDPLLMRLRAAPAFSEIRSLSVACQQQFLEHRKHAS